jgi:tyrosine-specific transport protein
MKLAIVLSLTVLLGETAPAVSWLGRSTPTRLHHTTPSFFEFERTTTSPSQLGLISSLHNRQEGAPSSSKRQAYESVEGGRRSRVYDETSSTAPLYAPRQSLDIVGEASSSLREFWMPVISSALLITGNTFGASCLVLPELVQGPGLAAASPIFVLAYCMNLLSGLMIAEVAIQQKESSGNEVPSSFKELAEENVDSPSLATLVSVVSFTINALVFSFDMSRVGIVTNQLTNGFLEASTMSILWGASLATLLTTQTSQRISNIASVCVTLLFATLGTILLPGLAATDPIAAWTQSALAAEPMGALGDMAPVVLMALCFQNIVPTITRLQDYDRTKTMTSIVLGSLIPVAMYLAWCVACLGGGIDLGSVGLESGPLLAVFSLATLAGSSIGCGLSCASELDTFLVKEEDDASLTKNEDDSKDRFQLPSVLATVGLPLSLTLAVTTFGDGDLTGALKVAGGLGSPLLYGVLPVWMAWNQRQEKAKTTSSSSSSENDVPVGSMGLLGVCATGMFGTEVVEQVSHLTHAAAIL